MNTQSRLFYPFVQKTSIIKYIIYTSVCIISNLTSIKLMVLAALSYLMGAYKLFIILLPLYMLYTIYFTIFIVLQNRDFFIEFGDNTYKQLSVTEKEYIYVSNYDKIRIISWLLWLLHVIPLFIFIILIDKIKRGHINIGYDDPLLFIRKNNLNITMLSIVVGILLFVCFSKNHNDVDSGYFILSMPILLLVINMFIY